MHTHTHTKLTASVCINAPRFDYDARSFAGPGAGDPRRATDTRMWATRVQLALPPIH